LKATNRDKEKKEETRKTRKTRKTKTDDLMPKTICMCI
jgi:hypothetical protein